MSIPVDAAAEISRLDSQDDWLKGQFKRVERVCLDTQLEMVRLERRTRDEYVANDRRHEIAISRLDALRGSQIIAEQSAASMSAKVEALHIGQREVISKLDDLLRLLQPKITL